MKFELNDCHRDIPDEALLQDVMRVKTILEKDTLTRNEYNAHGKYSANTFIRHFGGWTRTLELCGIKVNLRQHISAHGGHNYAHVTDDQLLDDLKRVAKILCKTTFSSGEYRTHGEWATCTYFRRFGTWNNALEKAGLRPCQQVPGTIIATEDLYKESERIWVKLGRQPTSTDVKNGVSIFSLNTYSRHFGSWRKALVAFVNYVNEDTPQMDNIDSPMTSVSSVRTKSNTRPKPNDTHKLGSPKHKTLREPNLRLRFKVLARDHFKCCICGASPSSDPAVELHVDHIKPWSKGGETVFENLQTLCSKCNLGKSNLL